MHQTEQITERIEQIPFNRFHAHVLLMGGFGFVGVFGATTVLLLVGCAVVLFFGPSTTNRSLEDITADAAPSTSSFNVLKNHGYHLEHNFGHGKDNLAMIFAAMNLLAFAFHTVCDCLEKLWIKR